MKIHPPACRALIVALCLLGAINIYPRQPGVGPAAGSSPKGPRLKAGDPVQAQWSRNQKWYPALIVDVKPDSYRVHYINDTVERDEWLDPVHILPPSQQVQWTWTDSLGKTRTLEDLQVVLHAHQQWLESGGKHGTRGNFSMAKMQGVQLPGADLRQALFIGTELSSEGHEITNLSNANLSEGVISGSTIRYATLTGVNLRGAIISGSDLTLTNLVSADLTGAQVLGTNLTKGNLRDAKLNKAMFIGDKLNEVFFFGTDLTDATFTDDTDLTGADFKFANLKGTRFEPAKNPNVRSMADAYNLQYLSYLHSPAALAQLRNAFKENGLNDQRSQITYAIKRKDNEILWEQRQSSKCETAGCEREKQIGRDCQKGACAGQRINYLYYYLNLIFFDWPVHYGMNPERALVFMFGLWFICALVYDALIHSPHTTSGIFLIKTLRGKYSVHMQGMRIVPHVIQPPRGWGHFWRVARSEWRLFRLSMFFSLQSAFNIGFKEFDVGRWLSLLTKREYELRPKHWARTVAGFQSLLSLYLIAMWILTHFGQPFE